MNKIIRIGTRDSQLAVWQATLVQQLLQQHGFSSELVYIKSEGDIDLVTPLYAMGVQGVFTKTLDAALLSNKIDIAVHSMKDVPTQLAQGITQAAVLPRASYKDLLVFKGISDKQASQLSQGVPTTQSWIIATSSIRRKAQWLNKYPDSTFENLRGNVNTRLQKVTNNQWHGAIFAAAGLERIGLRPAEAVTLDWMLPAPAQGAITIVCRQEDVQSYQACNLLDDAHTALCVKIERDFLSTLMGGCSTPISALAQISDNKLQFKGNICSLDGNKLVATNAEISIEEALNFGVVQAKALLANGAKEIVDSIRNAQ